MNSATNEDQQAIQTLIAQWARAVSAGDLAVSYFPVRCGGENEKSEEQLGWMRMSVAYQRTGGQWKIVHEHSSVPFDPVSLKIVEDAAP